MARVMIGGQWRPMSDVTALLEVVNHKGHSDQKSHGRKGGGGTGGGGVRDALSGHGSAEGVSRAAAAEAKRITGRDIEFAFEGDPQLAAEHAEGVLQGLERFPVAPLKRVDMVDLPDGVYGQCSDMSGDWGSERISFSRSAATDAEGYRQRLAELGEPGRTGRRTVAGDPRGVALHEFGHSVTNSTGAYIGAGTLARKFRAEATASRTDPDAVRMYGRVAQSMEISSYSLQNDNELAAEAFADVMLHGDSASGLSKDIFAHIDASESQR